MYADAKHLLQGDHYHDGEAGAVFGGSRKRSLADFATTMKGDHHAGVFTASVESGAVKFESATAGSAAPYVTGLTVKTAGTTAGLTLSGGAESPVAGTDAGTYDLSGWTTGDSITVNGKEYKQGSGAGEYATVDALLKAMVADGLEVTGNKDATGNFTGKNVTIKGKLVDAEIGSDATTKTITGGKSTIAELGNVKIAQDSEGNDLTIKDLFKVTIGGVEVTDWTKTDKIAAGASIVFEAKIPGALPAAAAAAMKNITGAKSVEVNMEGKDEDAAAEGTKAKYEITFNFAQLAGNQRLQIGNDIFEISTSGKKNDNSHVLIDLSGLDPTKDADKQTIADRIYAAINGKLGAKFDSKAPTVAAGATDIKLTFEAKAAGVASDLGNVKVWDNPRAISAVHTYGVDAAPDDGAKHAKVVYDIDLSKLGVGDKITLGTGSTAKTVEIVEDKDENLSQGKVGKSKATNESVLVDSFYRQGYDQILTIANGKLTIEAAQQTNSGNSTTNNATNPTKITAAQFAANAGKVTFSGGTSNTYKNEGGALQLQIGDTSDTWNQMKVSVGDMHVKAMGSFNSSGDLVTSIDDIDITDATGASDAINVIKDAINYVSGVRGDLGAIQNRLEHTANNLSVMAENIQDAESTICVR